MRVVFIADILQSKNTGMGRWSYCVAEELKAAGFDVSEWFADRIAVSKEWFRLRAFATPIKTAYLVWLARKQMDVAIVHEPLSWPVALLARIFKNSMPIVFVVSHGVESRARLEFTAADALGYFQLSKLSRIKMILVRNWQSDLGIRLASRVICLNRSDADYIHTVLGKRREEIVRMDNGIDPATELPSLNGVVRDPNGVVILSQWQDYKGKRIIPRIWALVHRSCPHAHLTIVGTGAEEENVRSAFNEDEQSSITILPSIKDRGLLQHRLLSAAIFLMPSIYEGSPLAMIEAMGCGLAVVGSVAGGIPDLLEQGRVGHIFDWRTPEKGAELVIDLLRNQEKRELFSSLARDRAQSLTWKSAVSPIIGSLERISAANNK